MHTQWGDQNKSQDIRSTQAVDHPRSQTVDDQINSPQNYPSRNTLAPSRDIEQSRLELECTRQEVVLMGDEMRSLRDELNNTKKRLADKAADAPSETGSDRPRTPRPGT